MADIYEYFEGRCSICNTEGKVRHKNIWLIGSEGTDMCLSCEKHMLDYLNERKRYFTDKRVLKFKIKREFKIVKI